MAYGSADSVAAFVPRFANKSGRFDNVTVPTLATVEEWRAQVSAMLDIAMATAGLPAPAPRASAANVGPTESVGDDGTPLDTMARSDAWKSGLRAVLSKHYGCFTILNSSGLRNESERYRVHIIGRPSDVAIVRYMYAWLTSEIDRLATTESGRRAKNSFRHGAVRAIRDQLDRSRTVAETQHASGGKAALVLASRHQEAERWAVASHGKIGAAKGHSTTVDASAFVRGRQAGANIHLGASLPMANARALPERAS